MATVKAEEAIRYVLSREMLKLFGMVILGWLMIAAGVFLRSDPWRFRFILFRILSPLLSITGTVILFTGIFAVVYKLVRDATDH